MTSRRESAAAVCGERGALNRAGSTSALLPGRRTPSQRSMMLATSAGVRSSGTRTGSPPASAMARSYCGIDRSAYSWSTECGMGMAMRGGMNSIVAVGGG
jgi:hypothetical protein